MLLGACLVVTQPSLTDLMTQSCRSRPGESSASPAESVVRSDHLGEVFPQDQPERLAPGFSCYSETVLVILLVFEREGKGSSFV